jgi:adenosylcobinamide kinase / adenosylcobinamide-phosphate guanylyltransferase
MLTPPLHGLILGGQKSGKSRLAEQQAAAWLAAAPGHRATLVATAEAGDAEMAARIARHQADRAARVPGLATLEEPADLAGVLQRHSAPGHLLVVDCLTLWLTQRLMPLHGAGLDDAALAAETSRLLAALRQAPGPVLWVSNEIGLGVSPLGREVRRFLDALGLLHQQIAALCGRVQLMVAGIPLTVKGTP